MSEVKNTTGIQMTSLTNFMGQLSYSFNPFTRSFESEQEACAHVSRVSFETAVRMHNAPVEDWTRMPDGYTVYEPLNICFPTFNVVMAFSSSLVHRVKLQKDRKTLFKAQSHKVEFTIPEYARFFKVEE